MKININEPCHENWDKMTANDKGAFCLSCKKNVIDFSQKTIAEVKSFFSELPATEKVCGRFREKQLQEMSFDHFMNEFMSWKFLKRAAVLCFLVLGTTVFSSCTNEDEHIVGKIEVMTDTSQIEQCVKDTLNKEMMTMGEPAIVEDTTKITMGQTHVKTEQMIKGDVKAEKK